MSKFTLTFKFTLTHIDLLHVLGKLTGFPCMVLYGLQKVIFRKNACNYFKSLTVTINCAHLI